MSVLDVRHSISPDAATNFSGAFHAPMANIPTLGSSNYLQPHDDMPVEPASENNDLPFSLPTLPVDRIAPPSNSRSTTEEDTIKERVGSALKKANQWSGSRASPLIQIDRLLTRIELFCNLHRQVHYESTTTPLPISNGTASTSGGIGDANMPVIYWNDLLKHGGMNSAWNERKGSRRAYRHIYNDLLQYQHNPAIVPFLTSERSKTIDELETAFDVIAGRAPKTQVTVTPVASTSRLTPTTVDTQTFDEPKVELLEAPDFLRGKSSRKRKRELDQGADFAVRCFLDINTNIG